MTSKEVREQKDALLIYIMAKIKAEDWHAVADAAMDLREIEVKLDLIEKGK